LVGNGRTRIGKSCGKVIGRQQVIRDI